MRRKSEGTKCASLLMIQIFNNKNPRLSPNKGSLSSKVVMLSSIKCCLSLNVVFHLHQRSYSMKGCSPGKFAFHERLYFVKGCPLYKVAFHQRVSSNNGHHLPKIVFYQMSSSTKGHLPLKVVFNQRLSFIKGLFHQS